jgi:hypothetical protein
MVLAKAGFEPRFCDGPHSRFRFVGRIAGAAGAYLVYEYIYSVKAAVVYHGHTRWVIFDRNGKYLGYYELNPVTISGIAGTSVRWERGFDESNEWSFEKSRASGAIEFRDGPPAKILVDGEFDEFYK